MARLLQWLRRGQGLSAFAAVVLGWMLLVILEGAVVRATGSGAGCGNHWPLCNGQVIPHHPRLATVIEFTHRSLTGICSTLTFALVAWSFLAHPRGSRVRRAVSWTGVLLLTEALLGAVLVKGGYVEHNTSPARVVMQCVHFTNTMLLVAALALSWWWQRPRNELPARPSLRPLAWVALASVLLTGATGSVAALADTLFPSPNLRSAFAADFSANAPLLVHMRWMHPAASLLSVAAILGLAWRLRGGRGWLLVALLAAQVLLGAADVLLLAPITLQVLHLLFADLLWIALVAVCAPLLFTAYPSPRRRTLRVATGTEAAAAHHV